MIIPLFDRDGAHPPLCSSCKHNSDNPRRYRRGVPFLPMMRCRRVTDVTGLSEILGVARMEHSPCGPSGRLWEQFTPQSAPPKPKPRWWHIWLGAPV